MAFGLGRTIGWPLGIAVGLLGGPAHASETQLAVPRPADGSVYEGELLGGLYHGHGRLTWPSGTEYVGEFRYGLMSGEGKTTRRSGEVHEGRYAFGERHGQGRLVTASGDVYEGEFRNGETEGQGTLQYVTGGRYTGEFLNGDLDGKGIYVYVDGIRYEGDFRAGRFDGQGETHWPDGDSYVGGMKDGAFAGVGRLVRNGAEYTGSFARGDFHGTGHWSRNGEIFEGNFHEGELSGQGTHRSSDGDVYTGSFVEWTYEGDGVYEYASGKRYEGAFVDGKFSGLGKLTWPNGGHYAGTFEGGRPHGQGAYTYSSGKVYTGAFARGRFHGAGELRWETDGGEERIATGTWKKGKYVEGDSPELASDPALDAELILANQPALLTHSLDQVAVSRPGVVDLYFLGFGAWGEQDVFMREVRFAEELFAERFDTGSRSIALINSRETLDSRPLATVTNLKAALQGLSERMNPEEDILFLFLSSHGSEDHELGISLGKLPLHQLQPKQLDELLDDAGIPWKVVVVSSCYAGGFVEPLADEKTLVLTAASADRQSFGCSNEADFTYFGAAFLRDALPEAESFVEAFENARNLIREREADRELEHSEPQIAAGQEIEARLLRWRATLMPATPRAESAPANAAAEEQ